MPPNRVLEQLAAWREDLINLNRNNRLLYFRKTKSSTLELRQPNASALLSRLSTTRGMAFWDPPSIQETSPLSLAIADAANSGAQLLEDDAPPTPSGPAPSRRANRQRSIPDDEIACDVGDRETLLKALRWLERRATQEFMDKGLWILYVGIGMLDWIEQPADTGEGEEVSSPLVLIPVKLRRDSAQAPFELYRAEEDPALNPALAFKLQHDFGISLPSFEDEDEENIDAFLDSVRDLVAEQEDWQVRDSVVLSVFSFHKEAMYRDLQNNEVAVAAHPLVQSLALGHRADKTLSFEPTTEDDLDEAHPPEELVSILDCDASQRQCLIAAAKPLEILDRGRWERSHVLLDGSGVSHGRAGVFSTHGRAKTATPVADRRGGRRGAQRSTVGAGVVFGCSTPRHRRTPETVPLLAGCRNGPMQKA